MRRRSVILRHTLNPDFSYRTLSGYTAKAYPILFSVLKLNTLIHIFDADWDTYFDAQPIQIKTSAADGYNYTFDDTGNVVYDENDIKLVVKGLDKDGSIFGHNIVLYIENNSDKNVTVQTRDVSVNGFMADAVSDGHFIFPLL